MEDIMKKFLLSLLALLFAISSQAALVATDIDTTTASSDIELVFKAILGVAVTLFGFRKVRQLLKA